MPVTLQSFSRLHPEGQTLIRLWFHRGWEQRLSPDAECFEPFIYTYIAFNGWAACVTGKDQDRQMIDALKADPGLTASFDHWLSTDSGFQHHAAAFQSFWPIFSAKHLRSRRVPILRDPIRGNVIAHYRSHGAVIFKPEEDNPRLTMANTLDALYQVRCNLFHGEKCVSSEGDQRLVGAAFRVLADLLGKFINA
jgi:hypothetical protein